MLTVFYMLLTLKIGNSDPTPLYFLQRTTIRILICFKYYGWGMVCLLGAICRIVWCFGGVLDF